MNESHSEHSPLPWMHQGLAVVSLGGDVAVAIMAYSDKDFAQARANAALIVRACNSHDDLLAALNGVVAAARLPPVCPHDNEPDICDGCAFAMENAIGAAINVARAAIAKAEGR